MIRVLPLAGIFIAAVAVGCSSGNQHAANRATASPLPTAPPAQKTPQLTASVAPTVARVTPAATPTVDLAIQQALARLAVEALQQTDVPPPLHLVAEQVFSNTDYASTQTNAAAFAQMLNQAGRITGVLIEFLNQSTTTPAPNVADVVAVLDILSAWKDNAAAQAGLAQTLGLVSQSTSQPGTAQSTITAVDLGSIGDEVHASKLHVTSVIPGQLNSDAYIVGLRKSADTSILIFTGQNGAPTVNQVKQLAQAQANRLR